MQCLGVLLNIEIESLFEFNLILILEILFTLSLNSPFVPTQMSF